MNHHLLRSFVTGLAALLFSLSVLAVAVDQPLTDPAKEAAARALMKDIRCLVCQNQSIEDSNADLARDLRILIRERIEAGEKPEAIKAFLVARYGDWILLTPPITPSTYFLWISPFLVIVAVAGVLLLRRRKIADPTPLSADEEARLSQILRDKP